MIIAFQNCRALLLLRFKIVELFDYYV